MKSKALSICRAILVGSLTLSAVTVLPNVALAQEIEQGRYQDRMADLAEYLGTLHHLRGSCMESERQTWRDYMQEMIRLEDPSADRKAELVVRFNTGYENAKRQFRECNRQTAREAERVARIAASQSDAIAETVGH